MNGNLELEVGSKVLTANITLSFVKFHVVIWQVFLQNFVKLSFLIKKFVKWQHLFHPCKSNNGKNKLCWMNGKGRQKNRFLFKTWSWKLGQKFWQRTLFKRKRQIVHLTTYLTFLCSVGISIFFSDHYFWIMILFTARYIFFHGTFVLFHYFTIRSQGYYNTGWFNPKMRSCAAFWLCQQTINVPL